MKTQYKVLYLLSLCLGITISSCSSDNDDNPKDTSNLIELEQNEVRIKLQDVPENPIDGEENNEESNDEYINSASIKVLSGNGDYSAFSLNEKVATATYDAESNSVQIEAHQIGKVQIIVLDKNIESSNISTLVYENDKIELADVEGDLEFELKPGTKLNKTYKILGGNGGFIAKSSDEDIVKAEITYGSTLKLTTPNGAIDGEATVTITDQCDFEMEVKVIIKTTVIPYTETELESLKLIDGPSFRFNNSTAYSGYTFVNRVDEDGTNVVGVTQESYWGDDEKVLIYFKGDRNIGIIEDADIECANYNGMTIEGKAKLTYMNIFHTTSSTMYISLSYLDKNNTLKFGYIITNIKP